MCEQCHTEHDQIRRDLEVHIAESHDFYTRSVIDKTLGDIKSRQDRILETLLGPKYTYGLHADGEMRDASKGLEAKVTHLGAQVREMGGKVDRLVSQSQNGGVRAKLATRDSLKVWAAVAASLLTLVLDYLNQ